MPAIRTVTVTISPLLSDIIAQSLSGSVALEIVARFDRRNLTEEDLKSSNPDLILLGLRRGESDDIGRALVKLLPGTTVILLSSDLRCSYLYHMQPCRAEVRDISTGALLTAILDPGRL